MTTDAVLYLSEIAGNPGFLIGKQLVIHDFRDGTCKLEQTKQPITQIAIVNHRLSFSNYCETFGPYGLTPDLHKPKAYIADDRVLISPIQPKLIRQTFAELFACDLNQHKASSIFLRNRRTRDSRVIAESLAYMSAELSDDQHSCKLTFASNQRNSIEVAIVELMLPLSSDRNGQPQISCNYAYEIVAHKIG